MAFRAVENVSMTRDKNFKISFSQYLVYLLNEVSSQTVSTTLKNSGFFSLIASSNHTVYVDSKGG